MVTRPLAFLAPGLFVCFGALTASAAPPAAVPATLVLRGTAGPGLGKHVVMLSGDEEYRSEEVLPMLCRILAVHHGFSCTVLFALNRQSGEIDPGVVDNIPGTEALARADVMVIFTRFRDLPAAQMAPINDYLEAGKPVIGLRTATHAFRFKDPASPYARWGVGSRVPGFEGGFGVRVLGETWVAHHGAHGKQGTRAVPSKGQDKNPLLRGVTDVWGPTDVYRVTLPLRGDGLAILDGLVVAGTHPTAAVVDGPVNQPAMPVAWTRSYSGASGKTGRAFVTTMGAAQDFASEGLRRLFVNACYWAVGLQDRIPARAKVDPVGTFEPSPFKAGGHRRGVTPASLRR